MDEERMPKELVKKFILALSVIVAQTLLFSYFKEIGTLFVLGIFSFLLIFSIQNKKLKKRKEKEFLKEEPFKSEYKLTKEIP